jgi:thiamine-phosphate pyrophosphorylase
MASLRCRVTSPLLRLIDANTNRAREAMRMLEDLARFVLDDAELQSRLKSLRHEFTSALRADPALDPGLLLASRDTAGDVGTRSHTPSEDVRTSTSDLAAANAARLTEALRAIEEAAKALPALAVAHAIERIRYRAYDFERDLRLALPSGRAPQWRLCVLITESLCTHHPWQRIAELAIQGGADGLQLREKTLEAGELLARARWLVSLSRDMTTHGQTRAAIIINDRPDIALLAGADGVHLGQADLPMAEARRLAGTRLLIGVSCSTLEQARQAATHGADYLGLGPMFESATKPKPALAGPALVRAVMHDPLTASIPHLAISGITPEHLPELRSLGVRGVAVSSAIGGSKAPADACRRFLEARQMHS